MKKIIFLSIILIAIVTISCKKSTTEPENNNPPAAEFKYISLIPQDTAIAVNGVTNITANATGSELTYHWTASYGSFIGSGATVKWTVCHSDKFSITCEVKDDQGHSESKVVYINAR
jgi:hypothetical protein